MAEPMPKPVMAMPATTQPRPCGEPNATTPTPTAPAARPPQISGRRPTRCRMLPPSNALGRLPSAATETSRPKTMTNSR
ncbi:hypothetical protein G6F32_017353 [Rhizopus arrhizus]|nr:hypothetical protein G6F32_017353 [Rhizopus arrhizus]